MSSEDGLILNGAEHLPKSAPEPVAAPAPEPKGDVTPGSEVKTGTPETPAVPAAPAYTPSNKYKVLDQEKEFDPRVKGVVKTLDDEKYFRELYEKADGLDVVKPKLQREREAHGETREKLGKRDSFLTECIEYRNVGDFETLFDRWGIPEEAVVEYLFNKAKAQENPELAKLWNDRITTQRENLRLSRENRETTTKFQDSTVQNATVELHAVLGRPEVQSVAEQVDSRVGKAGTFFQLVKNHALAEFHQTGKDLSPEEAVTQVLALMGKFLPQAAAPQVPGSVAAVPAPVPAPVAAAPRPATLPRTSSTGVTPTKKSPRSIEDLNKIRDDLKRSARGAA